MEKIKKITKVLAITGANKGIGYSIIDGLLREKNVDYKILLGTRDINNGKDALKKLVDKYGDLANNIDVVQIDINNQKSVDEFISEVKKTYGFISCLVNNAGTTVKGDEFNTKVYDITVGTNYHDTVQFTHKVLNEGLIPQKGKIIFVGSSMGRLHYLNNDNLKKRFKDPSLNEEKLNELAAEFRKAIETNTYNEKGWPENTYCVSKILINKFAYVLGNNTDIIKNEIQVYSCCPGWVKTDMGGDKAPRTLEEGSVTPIYLVNLEDGIKKDLQGKFFYDKKVSEL